MDRPPHGEMSSPSRPVSGPADPRGLQCHGPRPADARSVSLARPRGAYRRRADPDRYLANDTTIARVAVDEVTYYHVELDQHDIVLAEGLPCESYLDVGDRTNFSNGGDVVRLFPDLSNRPPSMADAWESRGYAPLVVAGPRLDAARAILNARIHAMPDARIHAMPDARIRATR